MPNNRFRNILQGKFYCFNILYLLNRRINIHSNFIDFMLYGISIVRPKNSKLFSLRCIGKCSTMNHCRFARWICHFHNWQQFLRHYFLKLIIFFAQTLIDSLCVLSLLNSDNAKYNGTQQSLQSRNIGKRISCRPFSRKSTGKFKEGINHDWNSDH